MPPELPSEIGNKIRDDVQSMCREVVEMLKLTGRAFKTQGLAPLEPAIKLGQEIHRREKILTEFIVRHVSRQEAALDASKKLLFVPGHLERVGDNVEFLIRAIRTMIQEGIPFSDDGIKEVSTLFQKAIEILECIGDAITTKNRVLIRHIVEDGKQFENIANDYLLNHQQRLTEAVCLPKASSVYLAMLDYLKGIESHTRQIGQKFSESVTS